MTEGKQRRRPAAFLLYGTAIGILGGGAQQAAPGLFGDERWNWAEMAAYGLTYAVVWPLATWLARRAVERGHLAQSPAKRDRDQRSKLVSSALAARALPPGSNLAAWERALREDIRETNGLRWALVIITAFGAVLIGAAAVIANDNAWGVWAVALLVGVESLAALLLPERRLRITRRLLAEVATD